MTTLTDMVETYRLESCRSERTLRYYTENGRVAIKTLEAGGRHALPWEVDASDIKWLLDEFASRGLAVATRRGYMSAVRAWLSFYDNNVVDSMDIRWPADMRPTVDWLTQEQASMLLALPMNPAQELVVHCELCLGMRRIEVLRLRPESFHDSYVEILGKGSMGGKPRSMPYHRNTLEVVNRYNHYRDTLIDLARMQDPNVEVPEAMMIWMRGKRLLEYAPKGSGIDSMLKPLAEQIGTTFSNHTLRRTFGRTMWKSGVDVVTISRMLGHETTTMTLRYIGADMDEMKEAMRLYSLRAVGPKIFGKR